MLPAKCAETELRGYHYGADTCRGLQGKYNVDLYPSNAFFNLWKTSFLFVGPLIPYFGLLVTSALGFKALSGAADQRT